MGGIRGMGYIHFFGWGGEGERLSFGNKSQCFLPVSALSIL